MGSTERLHIRWNDFESNIKLGLSELRQEKELFDVTLACGSKQIKAHKVILSACSPFFRSIIKSVPHEHPLLYLRGVQFHHLESLLAFIYNGEVNVTQEELDSFLAVAEELKVKGLSQNEGSTSSQSVPESHPPPIKRPRNENQGNSLGSSTSGQNTSDYSSTIPSSLVISKETNLYPPPYVIPSKRPPPQQQQPITIGDDDDEIEDVTPLKEEAKYIIGRSDDEIVPNNQSEELENKLHEVKYIEDHKDFESESGELYYDEEASYDTSGPSEDTLPPDRNKDYELQHNDEWISVCEEIQNYFESISVRLGGASYQCLLCAKNLRDRFNARSHYVTHYFQTADRKDSIKRFDDLVERNIIFIDKVKSSCMICRRVLKIKGSTALRMHFIMKHCNIF
ncbi:uncharacterized protein [Lepeophtheirus salmonis]|uniref:BTB domain-containing protein n=1 Tax=Lepeophtheirus salmonis TaxID=72036 RepID=A0A0K2TV99_LEPSM|nr:zinc finger and BTB domain-containing protein 17-like [Lepeophtheirus salmonis]